MALRNIGASNKDDAFYRYKMPSFITKIEGKGNGIRTRIDNMSAIAKALARPASYITKYIGSGLEAISNLDEKEEKALVNGAHDTARLDGLLETFINKYVQCYGCRNPETEILISRNQTISLKCAACGFVSDVDMGGKLTNFIIKNPPEQKKGEAADAKLKKVKKGAKKKSSSSKESTAKGAAAKKAVADGNAGAADDDDDDVQWQTDTSLEAAKQRMQEQLSAATAEMIVLSTERAEKKKKKQAPHKEVSANGSSKPQDITDDKQHIAKATPYDELVKEIKANLINVATAAQLKGMLSSSTLPSQDVMNALFEALFEGMDKGFKEGVKKNMKYLAAAVPEEGSQTLLLHAIEAFGGNCTCYEALKEVPFVLEALYHGDVLEEETIVQWYDAAVAVSRNSQSQMAKPFVEWLQSADSESSGEE